MVTPTILPNGDLLYEASEGKLLLQLDTHLTFKKAYEKANGKHHKYEEIDEPVPNEEEAVAAEEAE